ncbi:hypothetical protein [Streptomyces sp. NPDC015125]|uniref:hypothetical protein n=1 Tax=Streptomyces sp. NPDC015125 TaxID=3364938 RepID=UPI003703250A
MADRPIRTYLVINPGPLFGTRRITFRSSAPAGHVIDVDVDGRPVRALLTDTPLDGDLLAAEREITYL